jgi:hypothetical protein
MVKSQDIIPDLKDAKKVSLQQELFITNVKFWLFVSIVLAVYSTFLVTWNFFFQHFAPHSEFESVKNNVSWIKPGDSKTVAPYARLQLAQGDVNSGWLLEQSGLLYNSFTKRWYFYEGDEPFQGTVPVKLGDVSCKNLEVEDVIIKGMLTLPDGINVGGSSGYDGTNLIPSVSNTYTLGSSNFQWLRIWGSNYETSDIRLKKDIKPCSLGLDFVCKLNPIEYKMKGVDEVKLGLSAQEVETLVGAGLSMVQKDEQGYYSVKYTELIAPLINAVKNLSEQVEQLKFKLNAL